MSHFHTFICDRCANPVKGNCDGTTPQYWTRIIAQSQLGRDSRTDKEIYLCGQCFSLVEKLMRSKAMELIDTERYERVERHDPGSISS